MNTKALSKLLSLVLRHRPEVIGIELDAQGWTDVDALVQKLQSKMPGVDFDVLEEVVFTNDKQRFALNADQTKIRANQGHSVTVDLELRAVAPPELLYHGTVARFLDAIRMEGLKKGTRQHVHLSKDMETAVKVGSRRGKPVILTIQSREMTQAGYSFYCSENGVWLCDSVPAEFITFPV